MKSNRGLMPVCAVILAMAVLLCGCGEKAAAGKGETASGKEADSGEAQKQKVQLVICTPPLLYGKLGGENAENAAYTDFLTFAAEKFAAQYTEADVE